ncbi:MAG: hypothetical protein GY703_08660 [Gammaproteobacteria bacterium]|nr:hypothetical protein [Gammaproteobacteria bacterium]
MCFLTASRRVFCLALLLIILPAPRYSGGADGIVLSLGSLSGEDWLAEELLLRVTWSTGDLARFSLTATRIEHPLLTRPLIAPRIDCQEGSVSGREVRCSKGEMSFAGGGLGKVAFPARFHWDSLDHVVQFSFDRLAFAGGLLASDCELRDNTWSCAVSGEQLNLKKLPGALAAFGVEAPNATLSGPLDLELSAKGDAQGVKGGRWKVGFHTAAFSDSRGEFLGEGLTGWWKGDYKRSRGGFQGQQILSLDRGAVLSPFGFLQPGKKPLVIRSDFVLSKGLERLSFNRFVYQHPGILAFTARGELNLSPRLVPVNLNLSVPPTDIARFLDHYLMPVLGGTSLERLRASGRFSMEMQQGKDMEVKLKLVDAGVDYLAGDGSGRSDLAIRHIDSILYWHSAEPPAVSNLSWRSGHLYEGITIGPSELFLSLAGSEVALKKPVAIPVLDGSLQIERLVLGQQDEDSSLVLMGYLTPISMSVVSQALGWPELSGMLSGMIPRAAYEKGVLKLDGTTLVRVFDGTVLVRNLQLEDLFGLLPTLQAEIEIKKLDLETLTSTFSFGKITGKLEGKVSGLRLEDWQPVSFDARLGTPVDDKTSHRISQRAVDNITNLGGSGVSGAISRSFLRMFKEFGYSRLGISCRLHQGVCEMGGVEPAQQGYYLVKGGGVPRIDILGFNRRTDWKVLVDKLQQISEGGTPVVE